SRGAAVRPALMPDDPQGAPAAAIAAGAAAQASAENFPVALRLLPARYRRHLMAVYRFARTVDDIGDEALPPAAQPSATTASAQDGITRHRLRLLDELDHDLARLYAGSTPGHE